MAQKNEVNAKVTNTIYTIPGVSRNQLESVLKGDKSVESILPLIEKLSIQDPSTCALVVDELLLNERVKKYSKEWACLRYYKTKVDLDQYMGNEELAILEEHITQCVTFFYEKGALDWLAKSLSLQANVRFHLGFNQGDSLYSEASASNNKAYNLLTKNGSNLMDSYALLGEIYRVKGNICMQKSNCPHDSVLIYYDDALEYFTLGEDRSGQSKTLINKAIALAKKELSGQSNPGENPEQYYQRAIDISEIVNDQYNAHLEYAIYLQNQYLATADRIWNHLSDNQLDQILAYPLEKKSEIYFQKATNCQSLLSYTADDLTDEGYDLLLDTVVNYYQLAFESCRKENNVVVYNELFDRLVSACPYFPEKKCSEVLTTANEVKDYFLKKNRLVNEEISRRNEEFRSAIEGQRRKQLWLGFAVVSLLGLLFFIYFFYRQKIKNLNTTIEIKQEALRAQMNPHFISNTINAIESLVNQGRNDEASEYLIDFSRLCRLVINQSRDSCITLQEEIETLKYFLSLEKLRLADDLDYTISVDSTLNKHSILVPPLILQPFVENAIWHGIKNKPEPKEGELKVKVRKLSESSIECLIEDNGVGRAKSKELQKASIVDQKSWGTTLTQERIKFLEKDNDASLEIVDLFDDIGNARGTLVRIVLPMRIKK